MSEWELSGKKIQTRPSDKIPERYMQTSSLLDDITLTATKQISSGRKPSATPQQQKQTITPCIAVEIGATESALHVHSSF